MAGTGFLSESVPLHLELCRALALGRNLHAEETFVTALGGEGQLSWLETRPLY